MRPPTRIARQGRVLNDTALTPYHAREAPANVCTLAWSRGAGLEWGSA